MKVIPDAVDEVLLHVVPCFLQSRSGLRGCQGPRLRENERVRVVSDGYSPGMGYCIRQFCITPSEAQENRRREYPGTSVLDEYVSGLDRGKCLETCGDNKVGRPKDAPYGPVVHKY